MPLSELFAGRNLDLPGVMAHLRDVAAQLGLEFGERTNTYNSRLAQELGKWAEVKERGHDYHLAMFKAYFVDGLNIAEKDNLISICLELGLDGNEADAVIADSRFKEQVDLDWQRSRKLGITAVPTFRLADFNLVGAQPYEKLTEMLNRHQVPRRASQ